MPVTINIATTPSFTTQSKSDLEFFVKVGSGVVKHGFDPNELIFDAQSEFAVTIRPSKDIQHDKNAKIEFYSYCTTELDLNRCRVKKVVLANGSDQSIGVSDADQYAPFPPDTQTVVFDINLQPRQFVFIGMIVKVTRSGEKPKYYLCDPQVGNGPTGTGGTLIEPAELPL